MNIETIQRLLDAYTTIAIESNNLAIAIKLNWYSNAIKSGQMDLEDVFVALVKVAIKNK